MTQTQIKYKVGDMIVHSAHGAGHIKGMSTRILQGEKRIYYTVETAELTYWLEINQAESARIRGVCPPATFKKSLSIIRKRPEPLNSFFRTRIKYVKEQIAKNSVSASAVLIRDMHARNIEKGLHINENRILEKLKTQFVGEWCLSSNIEINEATNILNSALQTSMAK